MIASNGFTNMEFLLSHSHTKKKKHYHKKEECQKGFEFFADRPVRS